MATVSIQHKVKDFAEWKKVFDSAIEMRKSGGELSAEVYRDASDPNNLTVINKWDSLKTLKNSFKLPN